MADYPHHEEPFSLLDDLAGVLDELPTLDIQTVLGVILARTRRHTGAEAGTIFIARPARSKEPTELHALASQNDRVKIVNETFVVPVDKTSIAGHVALHGDVLEIPDLYKLDASLPYSFNPAFDQKHQYHSQSMLAFPLMNLRREVVGVVQLINHIQPGTIPSEIDYKSFPMKIVDDIRRVLTMLGVIVQWADQAVEITYLEKEIETLKRLRG